MIKKFEEFINESKENYILYIKLNEHEQPTNLKADIEKITEIGEGDNKIVVTKYNTDSNSEIWDYEAFLYPFFEKEEAELYIREITEYMDIFEYNIFPATDKNPLMKYFTKY